MELVDTLKSLLDRGEALDKVAAIVERRIDAGTNFINDQLAALIGRTMSASLYAKAKEELHKSNSALLTLYKSGYPDPEIEKQLTTRLYEAAADDGNIWRREIVRAMRDVGTPAVLPMLEAILFDQTPTLKVKQMIAQAIETSGVRSGEAFLATLEAGARKQFLESVAAAIEAIRARDDSTAGSASTSGAKNQAEQENIQQKDELHIADSWSAAAWTQLASDPIVAMHKARCGAEALAKHLYRFLGLEKNGKPAKKMTLEELLLPINKSDAPEVFKRCLHAIQQFGNFSAHDQDDEFKYLNKNIAEAVLRLYDEALSIYRSWLLDKKSVSGS